MVQIKNRISKILFLFNNGFRNVVYLIGKLKMRYRRDMIFMSNIGRYLNSKNKYF